MSRDPQALWEMQPPGFDEIKAAADQLRDALIETPLLESERVNRKFGGRLLVKAESLQRTGSFKVRGAWNLLSLLDEEKTARGLLALSSGNHGQAVAWAARRLGVSRVVILMPDGTPAAKIARTRDWGAEIVFFDPEASDRPALISRWTKDGGLTFIPAYDDRRIIAGAGTLAVETMRQAAKQGVVPDLMIMACSGGGLSAGSAIALSEIGRSTRLILVEPAGYDDMARSLIAGRRIGISGRPVTICDALLAPIPGELTFTVNKAHHTSARVVSDAHVRAAVAMLFQEFRLVVEPGGAVPLAAVLADPHLAQGRTTVLVASGANVDATLFADIISAPDAEGTGNDGGGSLVCRSN